MKWVFLVRCASKWNFLKWTAFRRSKRFKAYTHELSVIDFIIVVFVWLSLSPLLRFIGYNLHIFSSVFFVFYSIALRVSVIYFNLFVFAEQKQYAALVHTWLNLTRNSLAERSADSFQRCFRLFKCHLLIHSFIHKATSNVFSLAAEIEILLIVYAILTRIYMRRSLAGDPSKQSRTREKQEWMEKKLAWKRATNDE